MADDKRKCNQILAGLKKLSEKDGLPRAILGICPNSRAVLKAAMRTAKRLNFPLYFAATLNQIDFERGYTGWTQKEFVDVIEKEKKSLNLKSPVIIAVDHGGPWQKDLHRLEGLSFDESLKKVKISFRKALAAGYDLIHVDPTVDLRLDEGEALPVETVVERTVELIAYCEEYCRENSVVPPSYEVGTEEVHGGMTERGTFSAFLELLKKQLEERNLTEAWPCFVVGQVGTDLHTTAFDPGQVESLSSNLEDYGSFLKVHYTDNVEDPRALAHAGVGGANVGPEFTEAEYRALCELEEIEKDLNEVDAPSRFHEQLTRAVVESGRWKKWLTADEKGREFEELAADRREWLVRTGARYIWTSDRVETARKRLYANLAQSGIRGEEIVYSRIERAISRYVFGFNLYNSWAELEE